MKKLLVIVALIATVALGIYAMCQPNEYNSRTRAEYRQMVSEGKDVR